MPAYYYDLEFLEGTQTKSFLGFKYQTPPTIDIISIGIVSEDNREYYAISKDFNLKEAWNRYDLKKSKLNDEISAVYKIYWVRKNVLFPIFKDLWEKDKNARLSPADKHLFTYKNLKRLISLYGKSNKDISGEGQKFIEKGNHVNCNTNQLVNDKTHNPINLYGYYSAYDHVALCWLFGKMIDLPSGFPMLTLDLKQTLDEKVINHLEKWDFPISRFNDGLNKIKDHPNYPKQTNEHSALSDSRFNKQLHEFLKTL